MSNISAHSWGNSFPKNLSLILWDIPSPIVSRSSSKNHGLVNKSQSYVLWEGFMRITSFPFVSTADIGVCWTGGHLRKELTTLSEPSYSHLITTSQTRRTEQRKKPEQGKRTVNDMFCWHCYFFASCTSCVVCWPCWKSSVTSFLRVYVLALV